MSISRETLQKAILKALAGDFINNSRLDLEAAADWAEQASGPSEEEEE